MSSGLSLAAVLAAGLAAGFASDALGATAKAADPYSGWNDFEGNAEASKYSSLAQINRGNVAQLKVAWTFQTGVNTNAQPIKIGDRLIVAGPDASLVALDPATGKQIWQSPAKIVGGGRMRGFTYWKSADGADERIIFPAFQKLVELDAKTGKVLPVAADLTMGLGREKITRVQSGTPPRIYGDLMIVGSSPGEEYGSPPGDIRAFNVKTGALAWTFHTVPHPGEFGYDTSPPDWWKTGGGNNDWGGLTLDRKRGIVFVVTGAPTYDFYGADRKGDNLFGNSLIALDARTGKRLWHFQDIHHDLWDWDITNSPTLLRITRNGKTIDAVALAGKTGFLFVFDRVTGKPVFPIEERKVPQSDVPGEFTSPTQPFSTLPPFAKQDLTVADLDPDMDPQELAYWKKVVGAASNRGMFTPPGLKDTVEAPGNQGGANWGMSAAEPDSGRYFVKGHNIPALLKLTTGPDISFMLQAEATGGHGAAVYAANCQLCHGDERQGQPPAVPALKGVGDRMTEAQIKDMIRSGKAPMPAFTDLPQEDVDAVAQWLKADGKAPAGAVSAPPPRRFPSAPSVGPNGETRYHSGYGFMFTRAGAPVIKPPWQTITAYDLTKGRIIWQVPVGGFGKRKNTGGVMSNAGIAVTAGKLVFAASESDRTLYAWDSETGKPLWETKLPSVPDGEPAIYEAGGREFIVWPASFFSGQPPAGSTEKPEPGVNSYVAFALPAKP